MKHRRLVQDAGRIGAREKPVAPGGKISPRGITADIRAPRQGCNPAQSAVRDAALARGGAAAASPATAKPSITSRRANRLESIMQFC